MTDPKFLQEAIIKFLHQQDANSFRDQGQPNYPSETWPYTILVDALRATGTEYTRPTNVRA